MHPALTGISNPYMAALLVAQGLSVQLPVGDATVDRLLAIRASHSTRTTGDTVTLTSPDDGVSRHPLSGQSTQLSSGDTTNDRFLAQKRSPSSTPPDGNTTNNSWCNFFSSWHQKPQSENSTNSWRTLKN
jgi:hypothetical protein